MGLFGSKPLNIDEIDEDDETPAPIDNRPEPVAEELSEG